MTVSKKYRYMDLLRSDEFAASMLAYVKNLLAPVDSLSKSGVSLPFRSRFAHTERVTEWALRLSEAEGGDMGVISVAAIFHDSGYAYGGDGHACRSASVFDAYAAELLRADNFSPAAPIPRGAGIARAIHNAVFTAESRDKIKEAISVHSSKDLPFQAVGAEAAILMDADMLDEAGAMKVLFDAFCETSEPGYDYRSAYERILAQYNADADEAGRYHTREGRRQYLKMRRYVGGFIRCLGDELGAG